MKSTAYTIMIKEDAHENAFQEIIAEVEALGVEIAKNFQTFRMLGVYATPELVEKINEIEGVECVSKAEIYHAL